MRHPRRLTDSEREQRRERDRQRVKQATEQLLSSDGWQRWVQVRSRNGLARYSVNNQLIIALSRPDASYVCGFRAWLQLGYRVRKGEKAIWILAPIPVKDRGAASEEDGEKPRVFFRAVPVFDRTQVDAIEGRPGAARPAMPAADRRQPPAAARAASTLQSHHDRARLPVQIA